MANEAYAKRAITRWKPDLVQETYFRSRSCAPVGTPVVFTVYDMIHELLPEEFPGQNSETLVKRQAMELADHVICISEHTRNDLIRLFQVDAARVSAVHLGFAPTRREKPHVAMELRPYFLFVGHRGGYKISTAYCKRVRNQASSEISISLPSVVSRFRRENRNGSRRAATGRTKSSTQEVVMGFWRTCIAAHTLWFTHRSTGASVCRPWKQWPRIAQRFLAILARCPKSSVM